MPPYMRPSPPSAEWMQPDELQSEDYHFEAGKILLGRTKDGRKIGVDDNRHVVTIAGSRAGKSATSLMSNLLTWTGSVLTIDPKGELATNTAKHRAQMGQDVYILDPFGEVSGDAAKYRADFDPLAEIFAGDEMDIVDNAMLIAEALIVPDKGAKSDHWSLSAKNLLRGLILLAVNRQQTQDITASLNEVREWVTAPTGDDDSTPDGDRLWLSTLFTVMMDNPDAFDGALAGVGGTMKGKPQDERGSIISTAVEQTSFLDSTPMKAHLAPSKLKTLRTLKRKPTTIYLVLPASRMATHFRWLRTIITLAMSALENEPQPEGTPPVLFILEEFPQLGYMRQLEAAAGLMAGYNVKLWTVMQDLSQIKALYRDSWETFLGNAGVVEAFGNTDSTTLEYLSKRLGMTLAVQQQPENLSLSAQQGGMPRDRDTVVTVPLMASHEIAIGFSRDMQNKLVMIAGKKPFILRRIFWKDLLNG
ncbi:type IV secretion system protein VirD4 [Epibacterium ulvae]|uniref:Type IV secretion system protein VirD4 n=1 Tax=Epibacterium ulvae TaxID=1156985 RepID=A0A1G5RJQ3_9RHOB|nr:type IV secretory system conjugative DNA transfer family protein [Epibacterium ulvae]SCZ74313.1 type IV secretion system protein VirD4 [Epibacterium ulvae]